MKRNQKKPKKPTTSQLKKKLDSLFSLYIRNKYADHSGYVQCYTCQKVAPISEMQCGHFIPRQHLKLRYDERNCRVQCVGCNVFGKGKIAEFGVRLESEQKGLVAQLFIESREIVKDFPYQEFIEKYKKYGEQKHILYKTTGESQYPDPLEYWP